MSPTTKHNFTLNLNNLPKVQISFFLEEIRWTNDKIKWINDQTAVFN